MLSPRLLVVRQSELALFVAAFALTASCFAASPLNAPELTGALPAVRVIEKACTGGDAASCWFLNKTPSPAKAAVLQGPSSSTTVRLSSWSPSQLHWSFVDVAGHRRLVAASFLHHTQEESADEIAEFHFKKLRAGREYLALAFDASGQFVDGRRFRVLAPPKEFRVAMTACLDDRYDDEQRKMWPQLLRDTPTVLLLLGDNVYGTRNREGAPKDADPEQLWRRQREGREKFLLYRSERLVPTFAVWDDHDFGMRDGDATFPHKEAAREVHRAFFATGPGPDLKTGPGVSMSFNVGTTRFVLADDRTFRANADVWGKEQTAWILSELALAKELAFLGNGHQFFGAYHRFESFERYAPDVLKAFLTDTKKLRAPLVLLSGDRHLIELQTLEPSLFGYETWELTSSALHAKTYPDAWKDAPNARQKDGKSGAVNYALIDVARKTLRFRARGIDDATFFDRVVPIPGPVPRTK